MFPLYANPPRAACSSCVEVDVSQDIAEKVMEARSFRVTLEPVDAEGWGRWAHVFLFLFFVSPGIAHCVCVLSFLYATWMLVFAMSLCMNLK